MKVPERWRESLGLGPIFEFVRDHKVQPELGGRAGWMYVFGFSTLTVFIIQVVTGATLATMYVPTPAHAHDSLVHITENAPFGGLLRGIHFFGASAMIVFALLHMARVFLTGSYKSPRQVNWMTGVLLLTLVFAMGLTGQLLRWDENGVWTVVVAAKFAERLPFIGPWVAELLLAGPDIGGPTLTRAHALHVLVLPATILLFVGFHLYLLVHHGVSEPPSSEAPTKREDYVRWYEEREARSGVPYVPFGMWREIVVAFGVIVSVVALALIVGPKGPAGPADPANLPAEPKPDWFVRWYYALLYFKPRGLETLVMVYLPVASLLGLLALPLVFGRGRRMIRHRPWAPIIVAVAAIAFGTLTVQGLSSNWTPNYGVEPLTPEMLHTTAEPVLRGAAVFHEKGCMYCHVVLGQGGKFGPDLTRTSLRLPREEITVRIVQGYRREMPAYRDTLTPQELDAVVAFLAALPEVERAR